MEGEVQVLDVRLAEALEARLKVGGVRIDEVAVVQVADAMGTIGREWERRDMKVFSSIAFGHERASERAKETTTKYIPNSWIRTGSQNKL